MTNVVARQSNYAPAQWIRRWTAGLLLVVVAFVLTGCSEAPWQQGSENSTRIGSASAPTPKPPTPTTTATPARNDLATGSAKRTLEAGGIELKINYWSTLEMESWTAEASKPLSLSAAATFEDGSKQDIYLTKVTVAIDAQTGQTLETRPEGLVDEAKITPGYLIKAPTSCGQIFTLPALPDKATSVTLTLTYELLAQSAPKQQKYAKQTATDTLTIALHD